MSFITGPNSVLEPGALLDLLADDEDDDNNDPPEPRNSWASNSGLVTLPFSPAGMARIQGIWVSVMIPALPPLPPPNTFPAQQSPEIYFATRRRRVCLSLESFDEEEQREDREILLSVIGGTLEEAVLSYEGRWLLGLPLDGDD